MYKGHSCVMSECSNHETGFVNMCVPRPMINGSILLKYQGVVYIARFFSYSSAAKILDVLERHLWVLWKGVVNPYFPPLTYSTLRYGPFT